MKVVNRFDTCGACDCIRGIEVPCKECPGTKCSGCGRTYKTKSEHDCNYKPEPLQYTKLNIDTATILHQFKDAVGEDMLAAMGRELVNNAKRIDKAAKVLYLQNCERSGIENPTPWENMPSEVKVTAWRAAMEIINTFLSSEWK